MPCRPCFVSTDIVRDLREAATVFGDQQYVELTAGLPVAKLLDQRLGLFQALTSIQEMTLTFVPKLIAILVVFWVSMDFMTKTLTGFFTETLIPLIAGG